jgi:hypothetical protein
VRKNENAKTIKRGFDPQRLTAEGAEERRGEERKTGAWWEDLGSETNRVAAIRTRPPWPSAFLCVLGGSILTVQRDARFAREWLRRCERKQRNHHDVTNTTQKTGKEKEEKAHSGARFHALGIGILGVVVAQYPAADLNRGRFDSRLRIVWRGLGPRYNSEGPLSCPADCLQT